MSLTTKTMIELKDKSFDKLYAGAAEEYTDMIYLVVGFLRASRPSGEKVLLGDVAAMLKNLVEVDPAFLTHLKDRKLPVGSWSMDFSDYILEQVYPQPELKVVQ